MAGGRVYLCGGWVAGWVSARRPVLEETSAFTACFQSGPMERFSPRLSPCTWNFCFRSCAGATTSGPILLSSQHLWAFTPDVFTHGHCQAAGMVCPPERLTGNPTAGLRAGIPSLHLPFFQCIHQISLSPYSVPGMLLTTHGDRRWEHSPDFQGLAVQQERAVCHQTVVAQ